LHCPSLGVNYSGELLHVGRWVNRLVFM